MLGFPDHQPSTMTYTQHLTSFRKDGTRRTKTVHHYWAVCDLCGVGTYVLASNLKRTKTDPVPGRSCRMTPKCPGKHRKVD